MTKTRLTTLIFAIIIFVIAFIFGTLGHLYSIIIFPVLALLQGTIITMLLAGQEAETISRKAILADIFCGISFFIGINLGVLNLIFGLLPNSETLIKTLAPALETPYAIENGIAGGALCGGFYLLGYIIISVAAGEITARIQRD